MNITATATALPHVTVGQVCLQTLSVLHKIVVLPVAADPPEDHSLFSFQNYLSLDNEHFPAPHSINEPPHGAGKGFDPVTGGKG